MRTNRPARLLLALVLSALVHGTTTGCAESVNILDELGIKDPGDGGVDGGDADVIRPDGGKLDAGHDGGDPDSGDFNPDDAGVAVDASMDDADVKDADVGDAGPEDAGRGDAGPKPDAGALDGGGFDAGPFDAGPFDAGPFDAGPFDAGPFDAGPLDAGPFDAGPFDAGPFDSGLMCDPDGPLPGSIDGTMLGTNGYGVRALSAAGRTIATAMVGTWIGTRTTPWEPARHVTLTFHADGSYSAICLDCCSPFYFGEAFPNARPSWRIDIADEAQGNGELVLYYAGSSSPTTEDLKHVQADSSRLLFDLWHFGYYGPVHFDLTRQR